MRKEITEEQITELMQAIPRAEEVDRLRAENERLRAMLPPTAHSGVRSGPGEGSWSVFAEKVVEERDAARAEVKKLRAEIERLRAALEYMVNVCPAIDPDGELAHELARNTLEGKP